MSVRGNGKRESDCVVYPFSTSFPPSFRRFTCCLIDSPSALLWGSASSLWGSDSLL